MFGTTFFGRKSQQKFNKSRLRMTARMAGQCHTSARRAPHGPHHPPKKTQQEYGGARRARRRLRVARGARAGRLQDEGSGGRGSGCTGMILR